LGQNSQTTAQQQNQTTQPWSPAIPSLQNLISQISGGSMTPTAAQTAATSGAVANANAIPNLGPQATGAVNNLFNSTNGIPQAGMLGNAYQNFQNTLSPYTSSNYTNPYSNPVLSNAIFNPTSGINTQIATGINSLFAGSGRDPSGNADASKAIAIGESQADLPLLLNQYNTNVGQQQGAASSLLGGASTTAQGTTNLMQTPLMNQIAAMQAAGNLPGLWMGPSTAQIGAANTQYQLPYQNIQAPESELLPIAGLGGQSTGTGTSTTTQPVNPWTTAAGLGLGLWSLSDARTKENIEPVGLLSNGLNIYRYNFKGDDRPQIGLLAQEVEKVHPEAVADVGLWPGASVKFVNYDLATRPANDGHMAMAA